jgi:rhamnogalacturonan acetylesterase
MRSAESDSIQPGHLATLIFALLGMLSSAGLAQTRPDHIPTTPLDPKLPTLWIIGDSTVRNGQDTGNNGQWGWGNPIAAYFDTSRINVQNWALGGTSSRTFQSIGRWDKVLSQIKPGDFLIMQFGHNDGGAVNDKSRARASLKGNGEETEEIDNMLTGKHEVVHTYGWYIRKYVSDAKAKGAVAEIVCSPIPRNRWSDGKVNRDGYTEWAKQAAEESGAGFIDLNEIVSKKYEALSQEKVTAELFPENETVHPDWAGAVLNAECVIEGMKSLEKCPLVQYLRPEAPQDLKPPSGRAR